MQVAAAYLPLLAAPWIQPRHVRAAALAVRARPDPLVRAASRNGTSQVRRDGFCGCHDRTSQPADAPPLRDGGLALNPGLCPNRMWPQVVSRWVLDLQLNVTVATTLADAACLNSSSTTTTGGAAASTSSTTAASTSTTAALPTAEAQPAGASAAPHARRAALHLQDAAARPEEQGAVEGGETNGGLAAARSASIGGGGGGTGVEEEEEASARRVARARTLARRLQQGGPALPVDGSAAAAAGCCVRRGLRLAQAWRPALNATPPGAGATSVPDAAQGREQAPARALLEKSGRS